MEVEDDPDAVESPAQPVKPPIRAKGKIKRGLTKLRFLNNVALICE